MGQAKQRGSFEDRRAQSQAAERAEWEAKRARILAEREETQRIIAEARRLAPKFQALPPVLKGMVLAECAARGVEPLWLRPPAPRREEIQKPWPTPRRCSPISTLAIIAAAMGGGFF